MEGRGQGRSVSQAEGGPADLRQDDPAPGLDADLEEMTAVSEMDGEGRRGSGQVGARRSWGRGKGSLLFVARIEQSKGRKGKEW